MKVDSLMVCTSPLLPVQSPCIQALVNIATINICLGFAVYVRYPSKKLLTFSNHAFIFYLLTTESSRCRLKVLSDLSDGN